MPYLRRIRAVEVTISSLKQIPHHLNSWQTKRLPRKTNWRFTKEVLRGKRQSLVAKKFGISQGWVSTIYNNITKRNDENLAVSTALEFIGEYTKQHDYITMKQYELEELLESTEDEKLKSKIIMDQVALSQILLNSVSHGKFMQALQHDTQGYLAYLQTKGSMAIGEDVGL